MADLGAIGTRSLNSNGNASSPSGGASSIGSAQRISVTFRNSLTVNPALVTSTITEDVAVVPTSGFIFGGN